MTWQAFSTFTLSTVLILSAQKGGAAELGLGLRQSTGVLGVSTTPQIPSAMVRPQTSTEFLPPGQGVQKPVFSNEDSQKASAKFRPCRRPGASRKGAGPTPAVEMRWDPRRSIHAKLAS